MKCAVIYFFLAVNINMKTSANTMKFRSYSNYDVEEFIKQLLASRRFDELAEKVADKAAYKIKGIERAPQLTYDADNNNASDNYKEENNKQEKFRHQESIYRNSLREGREIDEKFFKIDANAVMKDESSSQADHLRLNYKYMTRNLNEKKDKRAPYHSPVLRNYDKLRQESPSIPTKKASVEEVIMEHDVSKEESNKGNMNEPIINDMNEQDQNEPDNEVEDNLSHARYKTKGHEEPDDNRDGKHEVKYSAEEYERSREKSHVKHAPNDSGHGSEQERRETEHEAKVREERKREKARITQNVRPNFKSLKEDKESEGTSIEENVERSVEASVDENEHQQTVEDSNGDINETARAFHQLAEFERSAIIEKPPSTVDKLPDYHNVDKNNDILSDHNKEMIGGNIADQSESIETSTVATTTAHSVTKTNKYYASVEHNNKEDFEENIDDNEGEDVETTTVPTTTKQIRVEGNKYYAFVENPDYAEYHEEALKEKTKNKNPHDFLGTQ